MSPMPHWAHSSVEDRWVNKDDSLKGAFTDLPGLRPPESEWRYLRTLVTDV
ncbi:Hypothetical protein AJAP_09015 [Amycolatopsis japonica]|uniref:Uncharacterized protein n=1 Tax=Amycolatopsis japonica TaxID=208439 RepID=A0A075UKL8_9PSEU|nr:Hypothetical protein AJAP_09015 [Amycolatopsis japonica]